MEITGMDNYYNESRSSYNECDCFHMDECEYVEGNITKPIIIDSKTKKCEIRSDLTVQKRKSIRLWGQVKDCKGRPVKCALVKLVKEIKKDCRIEFIGVAHGVTDCLGFYQFDICIPEDHWPRKFRVLVSKQAVDKEQCVHTIGNECNPCNNDCDCIR